MWGRGGRDRLELERYLNYEYETRDVTGTRGWLVTLSRPCRTSPTVAGMLFRGVIRAPKKDCEDVRGRNVLLEYAIEYSVALGLIIERSNVHCMTKDKEQ